MMVFEEISLDYANSDTPVQMLEFSSDTQTQQDLEGELHVPATQFVRL